jgi:hypothetical protein
MINEWRVQYPATHERKRSKKFMHTAESHMRFPLTKSGSLIVSKCSTSLTAKFKRAPLVTSCGEWSVAWVYVGVCVCVCVFKASE